MTGDLIPAEAIQGAAPPPLTGGELDLFLSWAERVADETSADVESVLADNWDGVDWDGSGETMPAARWQITGTNTAAWAMAKCAEAEAELVAVSEQATEFHQRINEWTMQQSKRPASTREFFAGHLERYALGLREQADIKTLSLPNGKVATREQKPRVVVTDSDALMAWAETNDPDMIETVKKIPVSRLRDRVTLIEVPTRVVMAQCGCVVDIDTGPDSWNLGASYQVGTGMICGQCGQEALVGRWLDYAVLVVGAQPGVVPGVAVEPASVSATVKPEGVAIERANP